MMGNSGDKELISEGERPKIPIAENFRNVGDHFSGDYMLFTSGELSSTDIEKADYSGRKGVDYYYWKYDSDLHSLQFMNNEIRSIRRTRMVTKTLSLYFIGAIALTLLSLPILGFDPFFIVSCLFLEVATLILFFGSSMSVKTHERNLKNSLDTYNVRHNLKEINSDFISFNRHAADWTDYKEEAMKKAARILNFLLAFNQVDAYNEFYAYLKSHGNDPKTVTNFLGELDDEKLLRHLEEMEDANESLNIVSLMAPEGKATHSNELETLRSVISESEVMLPALTATGAGNSDRSSKKDKIEKLITVDDC